jgi:hypothetical protein
MAPDAAFGVYANLTWPNGMGPRLLQTLVEVDHHDIHMYFNITHVCPANFILTVVSASSRRPSLTE